MPNQQLLHFETSTPNYPMTHEALYGNSSPSPVNTSSMPNEHTQQADDFYDSLDHNKNQTSVPTPDEVARDKALEYKGERQEKDQRKGDAFREPKSTESIEKQVQQGGGGDGRE